MSLILIALPAAAFAMPWTMDMFDQPSHKAQEEPYPAIPDGSVPTNADPVIKDRGAAARLKNPVPTSDASIMRGKERYETFCLICHGATGVGDGPVGQKYVTPADLSDDYVQSKPDGDIFYTIKYGGLAIMPSHGDSVAPEDRWHIINYIKHELKQKKSK
ncbi:MAG: c-type cytochrome [Deltaproteobacteria bacterium]|nr:c-type cytochrome [Deltaproteobacteria bacterium]